MTAHDCESARARMSDLLEGELQGESRRALEEEIAACSACRDELAGLRATVGGLHGLRQPAPPTFLTDIKSQIHTRSKGRFFGRRWLLFGRIPFEWISFVMILAMLAYYIVTLQGSPTDVTPSP